MRSDEGQLPEPPTNDRPVYDRPGDSWMCGNNGTVHACSSGPSRSGRCPLADACHPKRSWYGKRRRIMVALLILFIFVLGFALRPSQAPDVFKPGELSSPHAQILSSKLSSARCAACHRSASTSPVKWFNPDADGHQDVSQTDRCLDCHHQTIKRDVAKFAHNLPPEVRKQIRARISLASARLPGSASEPTWHDSMPLPAVDQNDLECAACHREHRGADADLLAVSDTQCQTCHADRFGSFADSHPGWGTWPYGRGGEIAFDHQSHMTKHFPASATNGATTKFDCEKCHQRDPQGEIARTVTFESGCQSCHEDAIQIESAKGLQLFALPTIPPHLNAASMWPEAATGPLDGKIAPLAHLLMRSDPAAASSLRLIGTSDLSTLNPDDPTVAKAIQDLTAAHERLLKGLADRGQVEIVQRLGHAGISDATLTEMVRNLPAQLLIEAHSNWFQPGQCRQADARQNSDAAAIQKVSFNEVVQTPRQGRQPPTASSEPSPASQRSQTDTQTDSVLLPAQPAGELYFAAPKNFAAVKTNQTKPTKNPTAKAGSLKIAQLPPRPQPPSNSQGQRNNDHPTTPRQDDPLAAQADLFPDNSLATDPLAADPLATDPLATDPLAADPLAADPLATDPLASDPLAADPLANDPLASDPLSQPPSSAPPNRSARFDVEAMMPSGGWYRDPIRLSIAYRGNGHSDPVLKAAVELIGHLPPSDPVRKQLLASRSMATCVSCHTTATELRPNWHAQQLVGAKTEFTKFTHGPHLKIAQLADCTHCHEVNPQARSSQGETPSDTHSVQLAAFAADARQQEHTTDPHEFLPLKKHSCATCHNAKAAGESCAKCHRYHISQ